jgi:hypothetical protein
MLRAQQSRSRGESMIRVVSWVCGLWILAIAGGCGASPAATDGGSGGGAGGGGCNTLANTGAVVSETANAGALPTMNGGTVLDGTYVLVSNVQYAGSGAGSKTHKRTLQISGTTIQMVNSDDNGPDVRVTLSIAPSGSELNESGTCPTGLTITPGKYTASSTSLAINKHGSNQVETYTRQ